MKKKKEKKEEKEETPMLLKLLRASPIIGVAATARDAATESMANARNTATEFAANAKDTATEFAATATEAIGDAATKIREYRYRELDKAGELSDRDAVTFDPDGPGSLINLLWHPEHALTAWRIKNEAKSAIKEMYPGGKIGKGEANAALHAYLSYLLTAELGPKIARRFTDANEVKPVGNYMGGQIDGGEPNPEREKKSDLFNNGYGRRLYKRTQDPEEARRIIKEAIKNGSLSVLP